MERKEVIRGAYRLTGGNSFYAGMITCSTLSGKAVCRLRACPFISHSKRDFYGAK